jgi:hypothetical protein
VGFDPPQSSQKGPSGPFFVQGNDDGPQNSDAHTDGSARQNLSSEPCGACHGTSAGLSVTDYEALMAGSSAGPVIVPGDPETSSLVEVLRGEHFAQLSETELETLIAWIANGAPESAEVTETFPLPEGKPVPHGTEGQDDCLLCHGEGGLKPVPTDHKGRTNAQCVTCHQAGSQ